MSVYNLNCCDYLLDSYAGTSGRPVGRGGAARASGKRPGSDPGMGSQDAENLTLSEIERDCERRREGGERPRRWPSEVRKLCGQLSLSLHSQQAGRRAGSDPCLFMFTSIANFVLTIVCPNQSVPRRAGLLRSIALTRGVLNLLFVTSAHVCIIIVR